MADQPSQASLCPLERVPEPAGIVIFGATGDLTARKLMPELYNMMLRHALPQRFFVVGAARTALGDAAFAARMRTAVAQAGHSLERWDEFAARLHYHTLDYGDPVSHQALGGLLEALERRHGTGGNRLYNLALPPALYQTVAAKLAEAGLAGRTRQGPGWARVVVEKPFGHDLASAQALNRELAKGFAERDVFRIDHYLAKETVQNIIMFRFANSIFEPLWNRNHVRHVAITAVESLGVEHRAGYYEQAGVLRDMFQNHMLQLLALVASEPPSVYAADRVRDEKVKLFRSLRPLDTDNLDGNLILGQYTAGHVDGRPVPAYRQEPGVAPDSLTPTLATMRLFVDNWRWQGVPFYITSGKRLARKVTRIAIQFHDAPHALFRQALGQDIAANRLVLEIHPQQDISLYFQAKEPAAALCLRTMRLHFAYDGHGDGGLGAYAKALGDCLLGDQTLFWRQDGVEECWRFLDPVLAACETCGQRAERLRLYPAGGHGPDEACALLPAGERPWA